MKAAPDTLNTTRPPRAYRHVARADASRELRKRIIDACIAEMQTHRLEDVTLDKVANAARTTRQTIIRLYENRIGLIAAAVEQWPAQLEDRFYSQDRITPESLVTTLCSIYEDVGERTLNFLALLPSHPELTPLIAGGRSRHCSAVDNLLTGR